ncbi:hypothetical protein BVRB_1g022820 [Beta vulgaris subsp. vulgaris]|uniref:SAWADEE domain-containing protein n=1 Tax=Beta vulgaris subsp. vulgaris TaxID=3555 RepID=A0A0J8E8Y4_BETVV|nr:uncharacterized protein LOC104905881 [Beta vulgaris subsp. vulgaris]XP_010692831.1 uncharacterized protein LOC104905881 [Beta vulgaris subsp. vulgaris]XP_010692833.1 uncharacterized protein LOC104905881 [Beta vulgaris subsp. vulgaris]XP_010692835.1 uncharacterized protein LOC104905881 [Beta vulgaris subsp. vulgaris]XP_048501943.1 uncharacterized protein LOC104905881 [Beta vulgaris subsp. vulgaris]XP_057248476.1 uncharacterized protein LOC104905881 [Beta vulgaris subsp. vulgaris]KMS99555.1 
MVDDTIAEGSEVKLEAKHKADGSWHPCQVSLCSGGGLSVRFEGQVSEDIILDVEDALVCLRVRSVPLQGDDCYYIEEGKRVLAACENNFQRFYFDAVVQKVTRVRHSKRASCRCTFMIQWLSEHVENGTSCIPSSSIMKLATESIKSHPIVAAFLNSLERSYLSTSPSTPTAFDDDDTQNEIDLQGLLKHIEGIGSFADASKKELLKDTLLGADHAGRDCWNKLLASEEVSKCVQVSCERNHLRKPARRQSIQPESETVVTSAPSSTEEQVQNVSPLSPLAARAVLASLVSKLPHENESVVQNEGKCVSVLDYSKFMRVSGGSGSYIVNKVKTNERKGSGKKLHSRKSNGKMVLCNKVETCMDSGGCLASSMRDEELTQPVVASRVTRSTMKRESANTNRDDETTTSAKYSTTVPVTRSVAHKGKGNLAVKVSEKLQDNKARPTRSTCSKIIKESEVTDVEDESRNLDKGAKCTTLSSTVRVTRSTARAGTGNLDDRAKERFQAKLETDSAQLDYSNSDYEAMISTKKRTSSLINAKPTLAESAKKQKGLDAVERRQKTTVEDLHGNVDPQSQKTPISSKKQPARFSPRLRFSPRIQSHDES